MNVMPSFGPVLHAFWLVYYVWIPQIVLTTHLQWISLHIHVLLFAVMIVWWYVSIQMAQIIWFTHPKPWWGNIPIVKFWTGFLRTTLSRYYMLSLTESIWELQNDEYLWDMLLKSWLQSRFAGGKKEGRRSWSSWAGKVWKSSGVETTDYKKKEELCAGF